MREILDPLLDAQRRSGFPDVAGAHAAATIPLTDRLVNDLIGKLLPPGGPVRSVVLQAQDGDQFVANLQVALGPIGLPVRLNFAIESQPDFPERPTLGLRLKNPALLTRFGALVSVSSRLPPGITIREDLIQVDLAILLARYDAAEAGRYVRELRVTTSAGKFVLSLRAAVDSRLQ